MVWFFCVLVLIVYFFNKCIDEDDNLNNGTITQDPGKALVATLGSIEVPEDSPILTKSEINIPIIQMTGNTDADLSVDDELSLNQNRYFFTHIKYTYFTIIYILTFVSGRKKNGREVYIRQVHHLLEVLIFK